MQLKKWKSKLSVLLALCTVVSALPMSAVTTSAADVQSEPTAYNVSSASAKEGEGTASDVLNLDFEDEASASINWGITNNDVTYTKIESFGTNKFLAVHNGDGNAHAFATTTEGLAGKNYTKLTLSYSFALESGSGVFYLPSLGRYLNGNVTLGTNVSGGSGYTLDGTNWTALQVQEGENWTKVGKYEAKTWYTVKIVYDTTASEASEQVKVYLDGKLTNAEIRGNNAPLEKLVIQLTKWSTGDTLYIDNVRITEGNHEPVKPTEEPVKPIPTSYTQNFDASTDIPSEWTIGNNTNGAASVQVVADPDGTGNVMALSRTEGNGGNLSGSTSAGLFREMDKTVLEYRLKTTGNAVMYLPSPTSSKGKVVNLIFENGNICYQYGGSNHVITAISENEWHTLRLVTDTANSEWYFYLDGKFATKSTDFINTEKVVNLSFGTLSSSQNIPTMYFDDFTVKACVDGTAVAFDNPPSTVIAGIPTRLNLKFTPEDTSLSSAEFSSSDESIATVDALGRVTGLKEGSVTITAKPHIASIAPITCTLQVVVNNVTGITLDKENIELPVGGHTYVKATVQPTDASFKDVTYESANPDIATVDEWGEIVALKAGVATIRAISVSDTSIKTETTVTVREAGVMDTIYVSADGSDTGAGTENDKVSLTRALALIAEKNNNMTGNIEVILSDGYYYLNETLEMTEEHGGSNNYSVVWKAAENAAPVIGSGYDIAGKDFTKWSENEDIYVIDVPEWLNSRQLFVDDVRATRARSEGGLTSAQFLYDEAGKETIGYASYDKEIAEFSKITDLELVFKSYWTNSRCGVKSVEISGDMIQITMDQPGWKYMMNKGQTKAPGTGPVWYENAIELLDEPGEWYLDTDAHKLYYMPRVWEDMEKVTVTMPVIDGELLTITGSSYDNAVQNIHFEGITFADTTWLRPNGENGHPDVQNNHTRENVGDILHTAAVVVKKANAVWFNDCTFTRLGINGLQMIDGVQNSFVIGNHFTDISGDAVNIGDHKQYGANAADNAFMKNCDVSNNYIHDIGVDYGSSAAISIGFAANVDSVHNEIFNIPYSGYHIGYGWGNRFANVLKNTVISNNFVHDLMGEGIKDGGAIYILGNSANEGYNIVKENYLKNQMNQTGVLYSDQGITYWKWIENVVDLSEVESWEGAKPSWTHINAATEHVKYINTYTTTPTTQYRYDAKVDFESDAGVDMGTVTQYDPADCPERVLEIINNSGLEAAYASLRNGQAERIVTNLPADKVLKLDENDVFTLTTSFTDGKDQAVTGGDVHMYYEISDTSVAEVSETGVVTAKKSGQATLSIYVISNHILDVIEAEIYVADTLSELVFANYVNYISIKADAASGIDLETSVKTALGRVLTPEEVTYSMLDSTVATVDDTGHIIPKKIGRTELIVTVKAEGKTLTQNVEVVVAENKGFTGMTDDLSEIFAEEYKTTWKGGGAGWQLTEDTSISAVTNGYATFAGCKYQDELFHFKLKIDSSTGGGGWPAVVLRAQGTDTYVAGGVTGYIICFGSGGLELHRFNGSTRTQIYGNVSGFTSLGGDAITPEPLTHGVEHDVKVGAINEGDAVRLYLEIDGKVVYDFMDTSEDAIKAPGYFGVVGRGETFTLTKVAEEVSGYTAGISADVEEAAVGDTVLLPVSVLHASEESFNAAELTVSYNDRVLQFNAEKSKCGENALSSAATVKAENGVLTVEDFGADKSFGEQAYVFAFDVKADIASTTVLSTGAAFTNDEKAVEEDLKAAVIKTSEVSFQITRAPLAVELDSELISGSTSAAYGKDYTFGVTDAYYDYTISATMEDADGTPQTVEVTTNADGTYTIANVTGKLVITATRTAKTFNVTFDGTGKEDAEKVEGNAASATYKQDYVFNLPADTDKVVYSLSSIRIGNADYTSYTVNGTKVTISGSDVKGDIVITVTKEDMSANYVKVTVNGTGAGDAAYKATAKKGEAYTLTLNKQEGYVYNVTATMQDANGEAQNVELTVNEDKTAYTIANVTGEIVFTIERFVDASGIQVSEYLQLNETKMWLVTVTTSAAEGKAFAYEGKQMFWSEAYGDTVEGAKTGAYCYLVVAENLTSDDVKTKLTIVDAQNELRVDYGMDVNMTGKVDASDAQLVYNMYNAVYNAFTADVTVEKFLRADTNKDAKIDVEDAAAVIHAILNPTVNGTE